MEVNLKAAEFEAEAMARLARIRSEGKPLKAGVVKKLVGVKVRYKEATSSK